MDLDPPSGRGKKIIIVSVFAGVVVVALLLAGPSLWGGGKGSRIADPNGGFSYVAPYGWQVQEVPGYQYKVLASPTDMDGFHPTIRIAEEEDPDTIDNFCTSYMRGGGMGMGSNAVSRRPFTTETGMHGSRVNYLGILDKKFLNHVAYFFGTGSRKFVITCSSPPVSGDTLDGLFDGCMKTFRFEK